MPKIEARASAAGAEATQRWYVAAVRCAVVAGVFSVIAAMLLFANAYRMKVSDLRDEDALAAMKEQFTKQPGDEKLLEEIRRMDIENRSRRFGHLTFSQRGSRLLLGGLLIFFGTLKWVATARRKLPCPMHQPDGQQGQRRQAVLGRRAAAACVAGFCIVSAVVALKGEIEFGTDKAAIPAPYPSMEEVAANWGSFRGPQGDGVSAYTNIPDAWDGESGQGILWKSPIPLAGNNSPLVWGDRVFVLGADEKNYTYQVYCYDARNGKLLWTGDVPNALNSEGEPLEVMEDTGLASCTGATDGRRVYVIFATGNVAAFDYEGKRLWLTKLGVPDSVYGYASSLALYQDKVIVQFDQSVADDGLSKVIALDAFTGRTVWETPRPVGNSWSSPVVVRVGETWRLFTVADPLAIAYDPATGAELWRAECVMGDVAPSPIYAGGLMLAIEPYSRMVALRTDGTGDVTKTHEAWVAEDDIPDICSPVSDGERVWVLTTDGYLTCYGLADGEKVWAHEFERASFQASPSLVGDTLYLLDVKGTMHRVAAAAEFKELGTSKLGDKCLASPAFADGRIYIRSEKNLYCIGSGK
ncbi:MAG: PQQ-binding-like beta-propeller repeat protein [Phycisphaerae bacterium]|nr:PQQ-binding-like beta-propeller repeat protein [Phycisphaerae bacterium]